MELKNFALELLNQDLEQTKDCLEKLMRSSRTTPTVYKVHGIMANYYFKCVLDTLSAAEKLKFETRLTIDDFAEYMDYFMGPIE